MYQKAEIFNNATMETSDLTDYFRTFYSGPCHK